MMLAKIFLVALIVLAVVVGLIMRVKRMRRR